MKKKNISVLLLFFVAMIVSILMIIYAKANKEPQVKDLGFCDINGSYLDNKNLSFPGVNDLYICGNLDSYTSLEINTRIYKNINDLETFYLSEDVIGPGKFQIEVGPDFDWKNREYDLIVWNIRNIIFRAHLDFSN